MATFYYHIVLRVHALEAWSYTFGASLLNAAAREAFGRYCSLLLAVNLQARF